MMQKRIVFIHIPKCAGTSITRALKKEYFPVSREFMGRFLKKQGYNTFAENAEISENVAHSLGISIVSFRRGLLLYNMNLLKNGYIYGHLPFFRGAAEGIKHNWHFVTILRDPISRFRSEFIYNKFKESEHHRIEQDIVEYLATKDAIRTTSQITNFLSGRTDNYSPPTPYDVKIAIENLKYFSVIGFFDDMENFVKKIRIEFGKSIDIAHLNKSPTSKMPSKVSFGDDIMENIKEMSSADIEVFEHAKKMYSTD